MPNNVSVNAQVGTHPENVTGFPPGIAGELLRRMDQLSVYVRDYLLQGFLREHLLHRQRVKIFRVVLQTHVLSQGE